MSSDRCIACSCPNYVTGGGCKEGHCPVFAVISCSMISEAARP
ncbi:MAG: hypothetical protein RBR26_05470 [Methanosarcina mazei]|nr:hypothetical protein [Methanosarcina mazei]